MNLKKIKEDINL